MPKKTMARKTAPKDRNPTPQPAGTVAKSNPALAALQAKADASATVTQLRAVQAGAQGVLQREVDTSRSPSLGQGNPNYQYPLPATDGVAEWAKDDYKSGKGKTGAVDRTPLLNRDFTTPKTARDTRDPADGPRLWAVQDYLIGMQEIVPVMVSMVGGKIGSIYFEGGRVRTTHGHGPTTSTHNKDRLFQYNIDRDAALQEYIGDGARDRYERDNPDFHPSTLFNHWIARRLKGVNVTDVPTWAFPIESLDDALPENDQVDDAGLKLFEVMVREDGRLGKHPSRGVGVKSNLRMTKADLFKLKQAGAMFADEDNPRMANQFFYNYVAKSLPQLLPYIRHPSEIQY